MKITIEVAEKRLEEFRGVEEDKIVITGCLEERGNEKIR